MYFDFRAFFKLLVTKIQIKVFEICQKKFIPNPNAYGSTFLLKQQQQQLLYSDKKFTFLEKKNAQNICCLPLYKLLICNLFIFYFEKLRHIEVVHVHSRLEFKKSAI